MTIPPLLVQKVGQAFRGEGRRQFLVETLVVASRGEKICQILIDTGAQPNLVRTGRFPKRLFKKSSNPLNLKAANQQKILGGHHIIFCASFFGTLTQVSPANLQDFLRSGNTC